MDYRQLYINNVPIVVRFKVHAVYSTVIVEAIKNSEVVSHPIDVRIFDCMLYLKQHTNLNCEYFEEDKIFEFDIHFNNISHKKVFVLFLTLMKKFQNSRFNSDYHWHNDDNDSSMNELGELVRKHIAGGFGYIISFDKHKSQTYSKLMRTDITELELHIEQLKTASKEMNKNDMSLYANNAIRILEKFSEVCFKPQDYPVIPKFILAKSCNSIGFFYFMQFKKWKNAIQYLHAALILFEHMDATSEIANVKSNILICEYNLGKTIELENLQHVLKDLKNDKRYCKIHDLYVQLQSKKIDNNQNQNILEMHTQIFKAIEQNNIAKFSELLLEIDNKQCVNSLGDTMLIWAIKNNAIEIAKILIAFGVDTSICNNENYCALYYAQSMKNPLIVNMLRNPSV